MITQTLSYTAYFPTTNPSAKEGLMFGQANLNFSKPHLPQKLISSPQPPGPQIVRGKEGGTGWGLGVGVDEFHECGETEITDIGILTPCTLNPIKFHRIWAESLISLRPSSWGRGCQTIASATTKPRGPHSD